ncbi:ArsR family transcriptional regulator [Aneurinibacillus soli]|uniref:HTH-type transcriptional repressor AseR n=2 Tax=Aneurinibacillus soli TaxID=1500254 RepID=A0A0U4WH95_9BACL|nr:ArsR family transcriptional regulator [Aneurinibacillus soli]BAU28043.1 HTH-type transcriptional repressor AseR [Aneurinibacillus soli]
MEKMSSFLKLVGDKTRLTILGYLKEKELCVCDLVDLLDMSQPGISQHLKKLRVAGIIQERREGTWAYFRLNPELAPYLTPIIDAIPSQAASLKKYEASRQNNCCVVEVETR